MEELIDNSPELDSSRRFKEYPLWIWFGFFLIGVLFKIQHWPFANLLMIASFAGISGYLLANIFSKRRKNIMIYVFSILSGGWFMFILYGALFRGGYPYNFSGVRVLIFLIVVFFTLHFLTIYFMDKHRKRKNQ
jgi:hypothetical protein